jgi:Spx/MgsR family transcriptional regulator
VLTLYGIPNCDTCKKAHKWLDANSIEHRFHDVRVDGLEQSLLQRWASNAGWEKLLNTRSMTWRGIPESQRQGMNEKRALKLMLEHPTLIKRPVLDTGDAVLVGFSPAMYAEIAGS